MSKRRVHSAESIIRNLRKTDVMLGEGKKVKDICKLQSNLHIHKNMF